MGRCTPPGFDEWKETRNEYVPGIVVGYTGVREEAPGSCPGEGEGRIARLMQRIIALQLEWWKDCARRVTAAEMVEAVLLGDGVLVWEGKRWEKWSCIGKSAPLGLFFDRRSCWRWASRMEDARET